jgi:hypothetical protein
MHSRLMFTESDCGLQLDEKAAVVLSTTLAKLCAVATRRQLTGRRSADYTVSSDASEGTDGKDAELDKFLSSVSLVRSIL